MPEQVKSILQTLRDGGYEAYIVGGCVRDSILERFPQDWDITTSATPEEVKSVFRHTIDTGIKHGTVTVLMRNLPTDPAWAERGERWSQYEVTTYRIDGEYKDARHPESVTFTRTLEEDLKRRDFTINAMAYNDTDGLIDLFQGRDDLSSGVIRAVGDPDLRFTEDALRIMRSVRFAAQLGFTIEERTKEAAARLAPNLSKISAERIRTELVKLLMSPNPGYLRLCYEMGITAEILPELDACMVTPQISPYHKYNVGEHIIHTVEASPCDKVLRLAALLHDIAKPLCHTRDAKGLDHFYRHAELGVDLSEKILRRLKFDNETIRKVRILVRYHDEMMGSEAPVLRKNVVRVCGASHRDPEIMPLLFEVKRADALAHHEDWIKERLARINEENDLYDAVVAAGDPLSIEELAVNGTDLKEAGIRPGPEIGRILNALLGAVLADPSLNDRETLLKMALDTKNS